MRARRSLPGTVGTSAALLLFLSACLRSPETPSGDLAKPSQPTATFPEARELAALPALPAPDDALTAQGVPVDRWTVDRARENGATPADDDPSPWADLARAIAGRHPSGTRVSPALGCAARETARFQHGRQGLPTESLRRFLVGRCGGTSPDTSVFIYSGTAQGVTDAALFEHARSAVEPAVERLLADPSPHWLGIGAHRAAGRFAVAAIVGSDPAELEALPRTVDASRHVVLRGTVRGPVADLAADINQGEFSATPCKADPAAHPPAFAFTCQLAPSDHYAWAQVLVRRPGRVLDEAVADVIVDDGDVAVDEYRAPVHPDATATPGDFTSRLLGAINRVRGRGRLAPVALADRQSQDDGRLVGTMLDAASKHRNVDADRIALGMLAGWDIDGTIRQGELFMGFAVDGSDAQAWVDFALERPFGRTVLLDPDVRRAAIASALPNRGPGVGAVVTTYAMFESDDHSREAARLASRLAEARQALRRPALERIERVPSLEEQSRRVFAGEIEPGAGLYAAMNSLAEQVPGARVNGFLVEANDVERAPIPDALLDVAHGQLALAVTHHRVKGAAWGQYTIFWLLVSRDGAPGVAL
jgi:hypothetical protein